MKRNNLRFFILFTLVSSMFFGISAISVSASTSGLRTSALVQATDNSTMIAVVGGTAFTAWGPTTWEYSLGSTWMVRGQGGGPKGMSLEPLWQIKEIPGAPYFEYVPVLATGYDVVESWPSEENSFGWNNTAGIRVMNITLRENVKFQDGSEWNATVAKWNIDRTYVLVGNLTGGEGDYNGIMSHMCFKPGIDYEPFFTTSWNYSSTYSNDPVNGLPQPPQYYGKDNDPNLSWTNVSRTYVADGRYSIINKTLVVKSADETASGTGGTIQIEWNENLAHLRLLAWMQMISMEQYSDMFYTQIEDTFDWTGDQLACGTGPYKAVEVDKVNAIMKMERFDDYWNFTEMRAAGKMIVKEGLISYITTDVDGSLVTNVMTAGDADFAYDGPPYGTLFDDQLKASPLLNYTEYSPMLDSILQVDFILPNTDATFRKAISYAFNYTHYITNVLEDRAIRADNLMGANSVYINNSIVGPYQDLTIARNALLNDPAYNFTLAAEGITGSSTTQDWNDFADDVSTFTNATAKELFTFNFLHDIFYTDLTSTLETSLADIGIVLNKSGADDDNLYGIWKKTDFWGMWYPMLFERPTWYGMDLEGFYVDWPMPKTDLAYLDAFYTYKNLYLNLTGTPQWTLVPDNWNWGLINDPVLQEKIRALYFQDEATKLGTYSDIQVRVGQELYTTMFISSAKQGYVINKKFAIDWNTWGGFDFGECMIGPGYEAAGVEIIPGFPLIALLGVVGISVLAISVKKRKKLK